MFVVPALHNAEAVVCRNSAVLSVCVHPPQDFIAGALVVAAIELSHQRRSAESATAYVKFQIQIRCALIDADSFFYAFVKSLICGYQVFTQPFSALLFRIARSNIDITAGMPNARGRNANRIGVAAADISLMGNCCCPSNSHREQGKDFLSEFHATCVQVLFARMSYAAPSVNPSALAAWRVLP